MGLGRLPRGVAEPAGSRGVGVWLETHVAERDLRSIGKTDSRIVWIEVLGVPGDENAAVSAAKRSASGSAPIITAIQEMTE